MPRTPASASQGRRRRTSRSTQLAGDASTTTSSARRPRRAPRCSNRIATERDDPRRHAVGDRQRLVARDVRRAVLRVARAVAGPAGDEPGVRPVARRQHRHAAIPSSLGGGDADKHLIYEGLSRVAADAVLAGAGRSAAAGWCCRSGGRSWSRCARRWRCRAIRSRSSRRCSGRRPRRGLDVQRAGAAGDHHHRAARRRRDARAAERAAVDHDRGDGRSVRASRRVPGTARARRRNACRASAAARSPTRCSTPAWSRMCI